MRQFRHFNRTMGAWLLVLALVGGGIADASLAIQEAWDTSGELIIQGDDWSATLLKERGMLQIEAGSQAQVRLIPLGSALAQRTLAYTVEASGKERVVLRITFAAGSESIAGRFAFDDDGTVAVLPSEGMRGVRLGGAIRFGIVPAPPLEDLIYGPEDIPTATRIYLPSENLFVGLLAGENGMFFCAWPEGGQTLSLLLGDTPEGGRTIGSAEITLDDKPLYLKTLAALGIWHEVKPSRSDLGKDVPLHWQPPFRARWKTQLREGKIDTSYDFVTWDHRIWRPEFGFYKYPVWLQDNAAFLHLGKKVSAADRILIYALERYENAPWEFARQHIGDVPAFTPRVEVPHYPENNVNIRHCDGRAWVKWIFRLALQTREAPFLRTAFDDFLHSIRVETVRLEEYEHFMPAMKRKLDGWLEQEQDNQAIAPFLREMRQRVEALEEEYWNMMDDTPAAKHLEEETQVLRELRALVKESGLEVYPEACYLLDRLQIWSLMESVPGRVGGLFRELFQEAGYRCAQHPERLQYAETIRRDVRQFLLTGETYETVYPRGD